MPGRSTPGPSRLPDPPPPLRNRVLDTVTPVVGMIKEVVGGVPVPGLETAVGGAAVILDTLQTMQNNKEDLRELRESLDELKRDIDDAGVNKSTDEQVRRLSGTSDELKGIIATCDKLGQSHKIKRFFQAKSIATQIVDVKQSIRDTLQVFQTFSIISIENNVGLVKDAVAVLDNNIVVISNNVEAVGDNVAIIDNNVVAVNDNILVVGDNIMEIGTNVVKIDANVGEIGSNIAAINKNAEDTGRYNILDQLKRAPARFDADNTPSECMDGTRMKLLGELINCVKGTAGDPSPPRFTLVCGIPGSGKSTIAKTVAVRLKGQGLLAASFFFSRNHATRREIPLVFSTIAFQLARYNNEYGDILSKILKEDADLAHATPLDQLEKLIIRPLSQLVPKTKEPWVILLDALDECASDHGETLLELLLPRVSRFPDHVRFFLTGRPENPILSSFGAPSITPITYMHTLDTKLHAPVSDDIRHYLRQSLGNDWRGWHGWKVKDDDLDALVTRAEGLFIFASTAVKFIRDRAARHDPQTSVDFILRDVDGSKKPRLLDELYFKIVDEAAPVDDEEFVAQYRRVLGAVINLLEPLSMAAIADLLGIAFGDVSRIVSLFSSVLVVSETVRIAHLSFTEYITGTIGKDREDLLLNGPTHHSDIANSSINLMNNKLHQNMCELGPRAMYARNADIPNLAALVIEKIPPSLRYACIYWASHFSGADNVDPTVLEEWLDTKALFWLEVLSICDEVPRAAPLIFAARAQYDKTNTATRTDFVRYRTLLSDISQFIATFYAIISDAAGHIYYSALPFTPRSSELFSKYSQPTGEFVRVIKGADPTWSPLRCTVNTGNWVVSVAFSPNGKCIAVATGGNVEIRSSESGNHLLTLKGRVEGVLSVAFSPDGAYVASGSDNQIVRIWSSDNGRLLSTFKGHTEAVAAVAFSPDGTYIASGSRDKTIRIWSLDDGQLLSTLEGHKEGVNAVAFSPNGALIASGSYDKTIRIWSSDNGQLLSTIEGYTDEVNAVVFSPDGARIASGSDDQTIRIWSLDNGRLLSTLEGHAGGVFAVAFSPDGARIASGSDDRTIRIWSSDDGKLLSTLEGHAEGVHAVTFSPDGAYIASGSDDETIRIWSSELGQSLPTPKGPTNAMVHVSFSSDGVHISSSLSDETLQLWSSETGQLIDTARMWTPAGARSSDRIRQRQYSYEISPSDSPIIAFGLPTKPPKLQDSSSSRIHVPIYFNSGGQLTLPSGALICIIPAAHLPIETSAQFGSLFALGLASGGLIILDFSRDSHFQ